MNCLSLKKGAQFACFALAASLPAGCERERWKVVHLRVESVRVQDSIEGSPNSEEKAQEPSAPILPELKTTTVADPVQIVAPQTMAVVRSLGSGGGVDDDCTGFFVSSRDFLTAKHCLQGGTKLDIDLGVSTGTRTVKCVAFAGSENEDWAICSARDGAELHAGATFQLTSCVPKPNTPAVIMGFCDASEEGAAPDDGLPNAGFVELLSREAGYLPARPTGSTSLTSACHLDSGGPAFTVGKIDPVGTVFELSGEIRVVGVISQIGKCPEGEADRTCLAPTTEESFLTFLKRNASGSITVHGCEQ